ncbi:unnamed protein product, partial [Strongylus vulgaris]
NTAGRTTPTSQTLASTIEPSTYGTSWNSVRWNKPSTAGYRSQSAAIASRFEPSKPKPFYTPSTTTSSAARTTAASRYSNASTEAAKVARSVRALWHIPMHNHLSLGPSVTARASRFDTTTRDSASKYRNEAREILNKWTSRERNGDRIFSKNALSQPRSPRNNIIYIFAAHFRLLLTSLHNTKAIWLAERWISTVRHKRLSISRIIAMNYLRMVNITMMKAFNYVCATSCAGYGDNFSPKPKENVAANGYLNKANEYRIRVFGKENSFAVIRILKFEDYPQSSSVTPTRSIASTISRYSDRNSLLSPSPTPQPHTPRAERPWRQRLAESSRIRATLGDDVSASYAAVRNAYALARSSR